MPAKAKPKQSKRKTSNSRVIAVRGKEEDKDELSELEQREADLAAKEKALLQKQKELQLEEKKLKAFDEELQGRKNFLSGFESDLMGREQTVKQWMRERDEEWLAQLQGQVELHTRKQRHALLIAVNKYADQRIKDIDHCVQQAREIGVLLEQLNFSCTYLHDDLPDNLLPTRQNIVHAIESQRQNDCIFLVIFIGHVVNGFLTPPRSSPMLRFLLCRNTPLEFSLDNIVSLDEVMWLLTENTIDVNDNHFKRKGLLIVDGCYMGATHGCKSEGFAIIKSTTGATLLTEYKRNQQLLLTNQFKKAITGSVNVQGVVPCNVMIEYLYEKLSRQNNNNNKAATQHQQGDDGLDFPIASKLLKSRHERKEEKEQQKKKKCTFTLTYTVNHDLDVHNPLLATLVADRLIEHCNTQGEEYSVEMGNMELVGKTEVILEGNIHYAVKREKAKLWKETVAAFTGVPGMGYQLVSGESTRQGEEGRVAVVVLIETESEKVVDTMRDNFAKMTHFFGHPCIDLRQHIRVTITATERQFNQFAKVAYRGHLDDAIFTFTALRKALHNIERFNNVDDKKMKSLVEDLVPICIVSSKKVTAFPHPPTQSTNKPSIH
eukprot:TRINITY_DN59666_c0_g1_i2.p1 TRINITY_DN59666_c0_g1~~TRINITY_DN59666_c0_g1_i2.p1  ORF type:complete len:625 (-),score=43.58 TRINITY_DN59666_c0_g1_i2:471-2282(-)